MCMGQIATMVTTTEDSDLNKEINEVSKEESKRYSCLTSLIAL